MQPAGGAQGPAPRGGGRCPTWADPDALEVRLPFLESGSHGPWLSPVQANLPFLVLARSHDSPLKRGEQCLSSAGDTRGQRSLETPADGVGPSRTRLASDPSGCMSLTVFPHILQSLCTVACGVCVQGHGGGQPGVGLGVSPSCPGCLGGHSTDPGLGGSVSCTPLREPLPLGERVCPLLEHLPPPT